MAIFLAKAVGIWIFALMVFHANPQNDPSNLQSEKNMYLPQTIAIRKQIEEEEEKVVLIVWSDIVPYVSATCVTIVYLIIDWIIL